jgi:hypothetical protein
MQYYLCSFVLFEKRLSLETRVLFFWKSDFNFFVFLLFFCAYFLFSIFMTQHNAVTEKLLTKSTLRIQIETNNLVY